MLLHKTHFLFFFLYNIVRNISKLHYYVHLFLWLTVKPNWTLKMTIESGGLLT